MQKKIITASILILLFTAGNASSQNFDLLKKNETEKFSYSEANDKSLKILNDFNFESPVKQNVSVGRSNKLAILFSAILPGTGEIFLGNKIRGLSFLSAEISMIFGRKVLNDSAEEIKAEFRAYANKYWNDSAYFDWKNGQPSGTSFTHTLPGSKTQQYYEMIGKYDQFLSGWPDTGGSPLDSEMRRHYMARQNDQNNDFKTAGVLANLMVVNRLVSVIDTILLSKALIKAGENFDAKIKMQRSPTGNNIFPSLYFSFNR